MTEDREQPSDAQKATRGVAVITLAKVYFLLTGFAQPLILTRLLLTEGYGLYGVVLNAVSILNNVVVAGSIQAMSAAVADDGVRALRRGIVLHVVLGVILAGGLALLAGPLGNNVLHDGRLPPLLRVGAIIVGDYCVYAALVGALNGQQRFVTQAKLDMTFATLRTALVLGLAATPYRVAGAIGGFAAASAVIVIVAFVVLRSVFLEPAPANPQRPVTDFRHFALGYAAFFAPVLVYQLALNLVLQVDLLVMKSVLSGQMPAAELDRLNGIYKAVQNFAFLPYQLLLSVTFVLFPLVSGASLASDQGHTRRFVLNALRFSAMALGAMVAVLTGLPRGVLRLAFKPEFGVGAPALRMLTVAQGAFTLAVISCTILVANKRTAAATGLMIFMLSAAVVGDVVGLSLVPAGVDSLFATAAGTAVGCGLGLVAVAAYTRTVVGGFLPIPTALRVTACTVLASWVATLLPLHDKLGTLIAAPIVVGVYVGALVVTRELSRDELAPLQRILRRKG